jgi:hypothetical protein
VDQLGSVAYRFDCYPQKLVIGSGRKGERVGGPPHRPGEQSPAEELSRFGIELAEVTAAKDDADHSGSFIDDVIDTQPVTPYLREWRQDPVPQYQSEADCAEEAPCHLKQGMTGQVGPSQLVGKGQSGGYMGQQVEEVPGLVPDLSAHAVRRNDSNRQEDQRSATAAMSPGMRKTSTVAVHSEIP